MKLYVLCPGGPITGGVEALHQLVDAARSQHWDAAICYYPVRQDVLPAYSHYDVRVVSVIPDSVESVVVTAETATRAFANLSKARRVLWWLSVDNFFAVLGTPKSTPDGDPDHLRTLCSPSARITHLTQSDYARAFLAERHAPSSVLTDYLSDSFMANAEVAQASPKRDLVLYNPKKGLDFTRRLIEASAGVLEWQAIENLSATGVAELLAGSKLYVDFGTHPGRDRIPREAAISGCCVITGRRGAAGNPVDLPIPRRFVLDETDPDVVENFIATARTCLGDFDLVTHEFDDYRTLISGQRAEFFRETGVFLAAMRRPQLWGAPVNCSKSTRSKSARSKSARRRA